MKQIMNAPVSRRAFLASAAGLGAVALAGCGASPKAQDSAPVASSDLTHLSFVLDYTPNTNHTGVYVAKSKGWYADEGLDIEIVQPPADGADALIGAGGAQLGISYQDIMANSFASDQPLPYTAVAAVIQHNTSGIMSRKADGITSPAKMQDHTYATWNMPVEQAMIKDIVEADGGDYAKVKLVPYEVDDEVSGLRANMFDCVWVYEGWAVQNAKVQDYPVNFFTFASIDPQLDYYTPVIAANNDFLKTSPDQAKAFLRATKKGYDFCVEKPDEAADILCKEVPELDSDLVHASQAYLATQYSAGASSWGQIDGQRWARFYQWLNDQKLVEHPLKVNEGYDTQYLG